MALETYNAALFRFKLLTIRYTVLSFLLCSC